MSGNIIQLNEDLIKNNLKDLVRDSVEETLNALLDHEADELVRAGKYERTGDRKGYRSGHYVRNFGTTSGEVKLRVPKLKASSSRRPSSNATNAVNARSRKPLWRCTLLAYPCAVSKISPKRFGVSVLVAIGVNKDGFREILGAAEGMKEDKESWLNFFTWLKSRGLTGVRLVVGDQCLGMLESIPVVFPEAKYQRCTVYVYRNVFTVTPKTKMKQVTLMLKAIHAQESKEAAQEKVASIAAKLREKKLLSAAKKVEESVGETLTYMDFPTEHWSRIRTNNSSKRVNREIRRHTRAIGAFPDGNSALMLVCARLRHVAASEWGSKRYMDMEYLFKMEIEQPADEENPYI